jgi:hypothetical protein
MNSMFVCEISLVKFTYRTILYNKWTTKNLENTTMIHILWEKYGLKRLLCCSLPQFGYRELSLFFPFQKAVITIEQGKTLPSTIVVQDDLLCARQPRKWGTWPVTLVDPNNSFICSRSSRVLWLPSPNVCVAISREGRSHCLEEVISGVVSLSGFSTCWTSSWCRFSQRTAYGMLHLVLDCRQWTGCL